MKIDNILYKPGEFVWFIYNSKVYQKAIDEVNVLITETKTIVTYTILNVNGARLTLNSPNLFNTKDSLLKSL